MKKNLKRISTLALSICLMATMAFSANAGSVSNAKYFHSKAADSYVLNAYTSTRPINGTRVTLYEKETPATTTQKFWTKNGSIYCAANGAAPELRVAYVYEVAKFRPITYDDTLGVFDAEIAGLNSTYLYKLRAYPNDCVLTAKTIDRGADVEFDVKTNDNNQKWQLKY